jgi:hypothetical protein
VVFVDIDEVAVPVEVWDRATAGDMDARHQVRALVHELVVYQHALSVSAATHVVVRTRELVRLGLLDEEVLKAPPRP